MGVIVFAAVVVVVVGGPLVWYLLRSRLRPGARLMALVGAAAGEAEVRLWVESLRTAGIGCQVRDVGDMYPGGPTTPYSYEVWV